MTIAGGADVSFRAQLFVGSSIERHLSLAETRCTAPEDIRRKRKLPSVPAPSQWFGIGGVIMALSEFGVASLQETSALSPLI